MNALSCYPGVDYVVERILDREGREAFSRVLEFRWCLRLGETVSGEDRR